MKKLVAKTGTYTNAQGETKNNWVNIGVIMSNDNGEYALLDPTVNLAGVLMKQRVLASKEGKKGSDNVMCSIFDDANKPQQNKSNQTNSANNFDDSDVPF